MRHQIIAYIKSNVRNAEHILKEGNICSTSLTFVNNNLKIAEQNTYLRKPKAKINLKKNKSKLKMIFGVKTYEKFNSNVGIKCIVLAVEQNMKKIPSIFFPLK